MSDILAIIIAPIATLLAVLIERIYNERKERASRSHEAEEGFNRLAIDLLRSEIDPVLTMTDVIAANIEAFDALDIEIRTLADLNENGALDGEIKEKLTALEERVVGADTSFNPAIIRAGALSGELLDSTLSLYENYSEVLRHLLGEKKPAEVKIWLEEYREKSADLLVECSEMRIACRKFILAEKRKLTE